MNLTFQRRDRDQTTILGDALLDGVWECFSLEGVAVCIPAGTYDAELYLSPHFGFEVVRLLNVPGRDAIEIHPGNCVDDTHGCILVGHTKGHDWVGESRIAFTSLMVKVWANKGPLTVTVLDPPGPTSGPVSST